MSTLSDGEKLVDFYKEFGLDENQPVEELQSTIKHEKQQWEHRAGMPGNNGKRAQARLNMLDKALVEFSDESRRRDYDRRLASAGIEDTEQVDWIGRAWSYYHNGELGAATVAARNARKDNPQEPQAFIISAWIEGQQNEFKKALSYTDEAYVYDETGDSMVDVYELRGVMYCELGEYEKSLKNAELAVKNGLPGRLGANLMIKASALAGLDRHEAALDAIIDAKLTLEEELTNVHQQTDARAIYSINRLAENRHVESDAPLPKTVVENFNRLRGDIRFARVNEYIELIEEHEKLKKVPEPRRSNFASIPFISGGLSFLMLIILLAVPNGLTIFLWLIPTAIVAAKLWTRYEHKEKMKEYENIKERRDQVNSRIKMMTIDAMLGAIEAAHGGERGRNDE